jgi:hypothetical protein
VTVVVVEPGLGTIPVAIEEPEVAVTVAYCSKSIYATTPRILAGLNIIRHHNAPDFEPSNFIF